MPQLRGIQGTHEVKASMTRRKIIWLITVGATLLLAVLVSVVTFPSALFYLLRRRASRTIAEPSSVVRIGYLSDFGLGVDTRFQPEYRICVVRNSERLYVIYARCTHLGCTPDWKAAESKFKCPCHSSGFCFGSAFNREGINCEGPAPRPLDRVRVEVDSDGRLVVNTAKLYQCPKGQPSQFDEPGAYVSLRQS